MQRALIKKKLEEQQENFRKKQELQQRGQSPGKFFTTNTFLNIFNGTFIYPGGLSPAKNIASPTQLAFTPTAVLRKMTADKEDGKRIALQIFSFLKIYNNF